jgi:UDP-N-acetylglucosamine 2-epimerase (non-hydrolysing)
MGAAIESMAKGCHEGVEGVGVELPLCVASSRSALIRLAPVVGTLRARGVRPRVAGLCNDLDPELAPRTLECFRRSVAEITADVERVIEETQPTVAIIPGDSDAAVASALVVARHGVPIARLGAGLRCGDRAAGDEVNRIVLDAMAERLYTDSSTGVRALRAEGVSDDRILNVGSTQSEVVARWRDEARERALWRRLELPYGSYVLVVLQLPENVERGARHDRIVDSLCALAARVPLVICAGPPAEADVSSRRLIAAGASFTGALDYVAFLSLQTGAGAVLTDSAGVQEDTTILGVPCFTFRSVSARPDTLTYGTNLLLGDDPSVLAEVVVGGHGEFTATVPARDSGAGRRVSEDLLALRAA